MFKEYISANDNGCFLIYSFGNGDACSQTGKYLITTNWRHKARTEKVRGKAEPKPKILNAPSIKYLRV